MRNRASTVRRALLATAVAGTFVLGSFGTPNAGADLQSFASSANGFALRVTVDFSGLPAAVKTQIETAYQTARNALPADVKAKAPATFPFVIDQTLAKTLAEASPAVTKATSILGEGFQPMTVKTASQQGETQNHTEAALQVPPVGSLSVLDIVGGILKSQVAAGPKVDGSATMASANAALGNVKGLLPTELQTAFADLQTKVHDLASTAQATVQSQVNTVESTLIGALPPAVSGILPPLVVGDLSSAVTLPDMSDPLGAVAQLTELVNKTTAQKTANGLSMADSSSTIKSVSVLGGLISVNAINLSSHSEASGLAGSAKNLSACSLGDVRLGALSGVSLDGKNVYVSVAGQPVAIPVIGDSTVAGLKGQVDSLLATAGITVKTCDASVGTAASDGKSANQSVSAFVVEFAPKAPAAIPALGIAAGDVLMKVRIDPTVQTNAQAVQAAPTLPAQLPHTGATAASTAMFGLITIAGALGLRRWSRS